MLGLSFFAFFLFRFDGENELAIVEPAARADAMRHVLGSALRALGHAGKSQPFPLSATFIATGGCMMLLWICHGVISFSLEVKRFASLGRRIQTTPRV
jgi:hypothetical protein